MGLQSSTFNSEPRQEFPGSPVAFTATSLDLIPGLGTRIPQAVWPKTNEPQQSFPVNSCTNLCVGLFIVCVYRVKIVAIKFAISTVVRLMV